MDYFEVFGLPRRLGIDAQALQRRFYELSRRYHPDFHAGAPREDQARTLEASARLNAAYRALRDPIVRIEYLVRLEDGRETREGAAGKPPAPPELLAEMFEIQEALAEARGGDLDEAVRKSLSDKRERLVARRRDEGVRLTGPLTAAWDAAGPGDRPALLEQFKRGLATRAYLKTVIDDLGNTLGEDETV
ncbi:MAG: Fe-S protein assembly co-chaperone HscB [Candidatus Rokuibacteriota bacterium]